MVFIPFAKRKYKTHLPMNTIMEKLHSIVKNEEILSWKIFTCSEHSYSFNGQVIDNSFTIVRNIFYHNSFTPVIRGEIFRENGNIIIEVFMRMNASTTIFMCLWLGFFL